MTPLIPMGEAQTPAGPTTGAVGGSETLKRGVIRTDVSPAVARWMAALFFAGLLAVPAAQLGNELRHHRRLQELDVLRPPVHAALDLGHGRVRAAVSRVARWLDKDSLGEWEGQLNLKASPKHVVEARVQYVLSRFLAFGNTDSVIALDHWRPNGWLFHQLGTDYLTGSGFLDPVTLREQRDRLLDDEEDGASADPRPAIEQFSRDCERAGIHFVFMPLPVKQMIQPAQLGERLAFTQAIPVPQNPSYAKFLADLRAAGVDVLDPTPPVLLPGEDPRYLMHDTHWTPQWMEQVAVRLATHLQEISDLPAPARPVRTRVQAAEIAGNGDILNTLQFPPSRQLFARQTVTVHRVIDEMTGQPVQSDAGADVLLLGDSFINVYSMEMLGWGTGAGLGEQLARFLGRPIDVIAYPGWGSTRVRQEFAARPDPLAGKRVIVWECAMHELTSGNWQVIPLPAPATRSPQMLSRK